MFKIIQFDKQYGKALGITGKRLFMGNRLKTTFGQLYKPHFNPQATDQLLRLI